MAREGGDRRLRERPDRRLRDWPDRRLRERPDRRVAVTSLPEVLAAIRAASTSQGSHIHGEAHWRRVAWHGLSLCDETPEADATIALLFAMFHDSMRVNDGRDPDHGRRGGALARRLNATLVKLPPDRLDLLEGACGKHTNGRTTTDPTVGVCWDSDRLDLVRLGYAIDPKRVSTAAARTPEAVVRARALLDATPAWDDVFARFARHSAEYRRAGE